MSIPDDYSKQPWCMQDGRPVLLAHQRIDDDALLFPPLPPKSRMAARAKLIALTGTPVLYSFTVMHASPKLGLPPTTLCFADYPEGVRVFGRLACPEGRRPVIGEKLQTRLFDTASGEIFGFELQEPAQS
ncbi:hypothetical protein AWB76_02785 [Caballeronia temeraria]|uniref:Uncharacterized protein n=1 Tax=Caballeronia temeraria TaxID=1777137 RepID=A0A158ANS5_9BURK|nr:OB-fold domain-containing protein [Caballeronia temeraria]SAK59641.1 hypothetical protein AWB76_02785 [Caballeronia temeraria]